MNPDFCQNIILADTVTERVVTFAVDDYEIVGNLAIPGAPAALAVVFVHGYGGTRNGPHGLLTFLARKTAEAGFPTLRFDLRGRGESQADGQQTTLATMSADTVAACNYIQQECGVRKIAVVGLCSGGNVAIGTLPQLPAVTGLFLISVYPFSDGDTFGRDVNRTMHQLRQYWHKALHRETWHRLVRGEVSMIRVLNVLFGHFSASKKKKMNVHSDDKPLPPAAADADKVPPRQHLQNLQSALPVCMIYGSSDPDQKAALAYYQSYTEEHRLPVTFVEVNGANHNFSSMQWKRQLLEHTEQFFTSLTH